MTKDKKGNYLTALSANNQLALSKEQLRDCSIELNRNATKFYYKPGSADYRHWRLQHPPRSSTGRSNVTTYSPGQRSAATAKPPREYDFIKSMHKVYQLIANNFDVGHAFLTLTFHPKCPFDITSLSVCNKIFHDYVEKLRHHFNGFFHVTVISTQANREDHPHAIHYHMICNLNGESACVAKELWATYGVAHYEQITNISGVIFYCRNNMIAFRKYTQLQKLYLSGHRCKSYLHTRKGLNTSISIPYSSYEPSEFHTLYDILSVLSPLDACTYLNEYTHEIYECYKFAFANEFIHPKPFATLKSRSKYNKHKNCK